MVFVAQKLLSRIKNNRNSSKKKKTNAAKKMAKKEKTITCVESIHFFFPFVITKTTFTQPNKKEKKISTKNVLAIITESEKR